MIVTYDRQNMFIVQATGLTFMKHYSLFSHGAKDEEKTCATFSRDRCSSPWSSP
jgi:hypothetical protein